MCAIGSLSHDIHLRYRQYRYLRYRNPPVQRSDHDEIDEDRRTMTTTDLAKAREQSPPPPDADSAAGLLRPYAWSFSAVVILQVIGALAGLAPLLAVVELGRTLLAPGAIDHDHVWFVVIAGAV